MPEVQEAERISETLEPNPVRPDQVKSLFVSYEFNKRNQQKDHPSEITRERIKNTVDILKRVLTTLGQDEQIRAIDEKVLEDRFR